jgi:RNA exonuclease 4
MKHHDAPMTKNDLYFALDCEMVGIGPDGSDSAVARVTLLNWEKEIILDTFVKVPVTVTDYRTHVSGIQPQDIESENAMTFEEARRRVEHILRGKILIGHGLENDLCAL